MADKDKDLGNPVIADPTPARAVDREAAAVASEANRVANEVEAQSGGPALFGPAAQAEIPEGSDPANLIGTGGAIHPVANLRQPFPGNWHVDKVRRIRESRRGTDENGNGFHEWRVRAIDEGDPIPFNAEAVPEDMPEHDWLPVE